MWKNIAVDGLCSTPSPGIVEPEPYFIPDLLVAALFPSFGGCLESDWLLITLSVAFQGF